MQIPKKCKFLKIFAHLFEHKSVLHTGGDKLDLLTYTRSEKL